MVDKGGRIIKLGENTNILNYVVLLLPLLLLASKVVVNADVFFDGVASIGVTNYGSEYPYHG